MVALDKSPPKVSKLTENIKRFALSNVHCYLFNSTKCLDTELSNGELQFLLGWCLWEMIVRKLKE